MLTGKHQRPKGGITKLQRFAVLLLIFWVGVTMLSAQNNPFGLTIQPINIPNLPRLHSFAAAEFQGKWYLFGGRRDGLHRRQPFRAFDSAHANRYIWRIDPITKTVDSLSIQQLPPQIQSQLAATNLLFHQHNGKLWLAGGYGLPSRNDVSLYQPPSRFTDPEAHRTFPYLTQVDLNMLSAAFEAQLTSRQSQTIQSNPSFQSSQPSQSSPKPKSKPKSRETQYAPSIVRKPLLERAFQQWSDTQFALTGGAMMAEGDTFYLVAGHRFDGLYNPMGPQNGPGFEQVYHRGVRVFYFQPSQKCKSKKPSVVWKSPWFDGGFRRRDVNVMEAWHHNLSDTSSAFNNPFRSLRKSFLLFSGVFQDRANIPYTNLIEINPTHEIEGEEKLTVGSPRPNHSSIHSSKGEVDVIMGNPSTTVSGMHAVPNFNQLLNQYHSAHMGLYSYKTDAQFFVFFGGIAQYFFNENHELTQDPDVPVVSTLSVIQRTSANEYSEFALPIQLPKGIGAGTEFIPVAGVPRIEGSDVIDLESLQGDSQLLGYLVGGLSTTAPNVFFDNDADESKAESHAYAVYWNRNNNFRDPSQKVNLEEALPVPQGNNGHIYFQAFTNTETGKVYFVVNKTEEGPVSLVLKDASGTEILRHPKAGTKEDWILPKGETVLALPLYDATKMKEYQVEWILPNYTLQERLIINP